MIIYVSHSTGCAGWDMEAIYEGTNFKLACRTSRFKPDKDKNIQMLDWDYLEWKKKPKEIEDKHIQIVRDYDIETVMSMDLWDYNISDALKYADKLQKYTNRVLIPVHYYCKELLEYDLAYPNANWFAKNIFPPFEYRDNIKHILGGSPQSQIKYLTTTQTDLEGNPLRFKNVESIDGNQLFNVAIKHGKEWFPYKPYWKKPKTHRTNEEIFKNSVKRFDFYLQYLLTFDFYLQYLLTCSDLLDFHKNGVKKLREANLIE
jgi:hypothetical protein